MEFHTLSRKQLQTLCKKNKIPANTTNVAMADALAALDQVEGLDEFLNPIEGDAGTPNVHHYTAGRASTQRKATRKETEVSTVKRSVSVRVQRGSGAAEGEVEQENKDANALVTPAPAGSKRRTAAVSTRRKKEVEMVEEDGDENRVQGQPSDVPKTPAAAPIGRTRAAGRSICTTKIETLGRTSVQRAYSTRRSVRLLEKDLSKMSFIDAEDTGLVKIDDDISQDTEKGSLQTASTVVSEDTQELEVCSFENKIEYECQSHDSGSDVKLVSMTENDMVVEPHGSNEAGSSDSLELETENKECIGARQDNLLVEEASKDAIPDVTDQDIADVTVAVPDDVCVDVTDQEVAGSLPMPAECNMDDQVSNEGDAKEDNNNEPQEEAEPHDSNLKLEGSSDTCDESDDAGSEVLDVLEESRDCSELEMENLESIGVVTDILPCEASEDVLVEVTDQDTATSTVVLPDDVSDQDIAGSLPMSPVNVAPANIDDDQGIVTKGDGNQDMNNETEPLNLADGNYVADDEYYEHPLNVDEKSADENDLMTASEGVLELESISHSAAGEHQEEELKAKPEQLEAGTEKIDNAPGVTGTSSAILAVEKEASCENSVAVIGVCTESSANGKENMEVKNVTIESSLLDVEATFENLEAEAQAEESEERLAGEDIVLEVDNAFSSVLDGMCCPQIPLVHQQVSVESAESYLDSCPLDGEVSCKSNTQVDGDVISEDTVIPNQEPRVSPETVIEDSVHEQKSTDILVRSVVSGQLKENVISNELHDKSIRELKRMLKKLKLDAETSNCNIKEVEMKRTALKVLPQNRMTAGEAQIDG
ncbi:hypothetical protein CR513_62905, partial [Mucuna pruriens]